MVIFSFALKNTECFKEQKSSEKMFPELFYLHYASAPARDTRVL
jgi:hypothetical protein